MLKAGIVAHIIESQQPRDPDGKEKWWYVSLWPSTNNSHPEEDINKGLPLVSFYIMGSKGVGHLRIHGDKVIDKIGWLQDVLEVIQSMGVAGCSG